EARTAAGDQLCRHLDMGRKGRRGLQKAGRGLHEKVHAASAGEVNVLQAVVELLRQRVANRAGKLHSTGLDAEVALGIEVQHKNPNKVIVMSDNCINCRTDSGRVNCAARRYLDESA